MKQKKKWSIGKKIGVTIACLFGAFILLGVVAVATTSDADLAKQAKQDSIATAKEHIEDSLKMAQERLANIEKEKKKVEEEKSAALDNLMDQYSGTVPVLVDYIKTKLNDPNSYENIETKYTKQDTTLIVENTFTAKNGFGGRVKNRIKAVIGASGSILFAKEENPFE